MHTETPAKKYEKTTLIPLKNCVYVKNEARVNQK